MIYVNKNIDICQFFSIFVLVFLLKYFCMQNKAKIVNERRRTVSKLYLQGLPQYKIAEIVGVTQQQVSHDLKILNRYWQLKAQENIEKIKTREIEKINLIENELWDSWLKSKENSKYQTGYPAYIEQIKGCIKMRLDIFGLNAPIKQDIKQEVILPIGQIPIVIETPEHLKKINDV